MKANLAGMLLLIGCTVAVAQAQDPVAQVSGQVRVQWEGRPANTTGPLAAANAVQAGVVARPVNDVSLETELRATSK
ncbi:MAG: hypothetical protein PHH58_16695, partial [Rhodoferax sp.]|nr:hypothetical protein [Rhodoferax sp.]